MTNTKQSKSAAKTKAKNDFQSQVFVQAFHIPYFNEARNVRILLPKAYFKYPNRQFPVVYMQDGQNLFDHKTAFLRAWDLQKMMDKLPFRRQCIIVGVDNAHQRRLAEYAPPHSTKVEHGLAESYINFLVQHIKPFVDKHFRTLPDVENTAIGGSSLGGLLALYACAKFAHIFGKGAILSPSLWLNRRFLENENKLTLNKIFVVGSSKESKGMEQNLQWLYWNLRNKVQDESKLRVVIRQRGRHNEQFWGREFKDALAWLFP